MDIGNLVGTGISVGGLKLVADLQAGLLGHFASDDGFEFPGVEYTSVGDLIMRVLLVLEWPTFEADRFDDRVHGTFRRLLMGECTGNIS